MNIQKCLLGVALVFVLATGVHAGQIGPTQSATAVFYDFLGLPPDPNNLPSINDSEIFSYFDGYAKYASVQPIVETFVGAGPLDTADSYRFDLFAAGTNDQLHARFRAQFNGYSALQYFPRFYSDHDPVSPYLGDIYADFTDTLKVSIAGPNTDPRYTMTLQYRLNGRVEQALQVDPAGDPYPLTTGAGLGAFMYLDGDPNTDYTSDGFTITEGLYADHDVELHLSANVQETYQWTQNLGFQASTPVFWSVEDFDQASASQLNGELNFDLGGTATLTKIIFGFAPDVDLSKVSVEFGSGFGYNVEFVTNAAIPEPSSFVLALFASIGGVTLMRQSARNVKSPYTSSPS